MTQTDLSLVALKGYDGLKIDTIASRLRPVKLKMTKETADGKRYMANHNGARRKANGKRT
jgi:hypothetical protein